MIWQQKIKNHNALVIGHLQKSYLVCSASKNPDIYNRSTVQYFGCDAISFLFGIGKITYAYKPIRRLSQINSPHIDDFTDVCRKSIIKLYVSLEKS